MIGSSPARWWHREGERVVCDLCPRLCRIPQGQRGFCFVRRNEYGALRTLGYGHPTGFGVDPVEKKPLYHFLPGSRTLSFGTAGCNLGCKFCQNWSISKAELSDRNALTVAPDQVVDLAVRERCTAIAYTYNDPVIFAEYVMDTARIARRRGIRNIVVSAGYISPEARAEFFADIDAANIDLKSFRDEMYMRTCGGVHLEPVKDTLRWLVRESRVWTEITTLVIPGFNDSEVELRAEFDWIRAELGPTVPLHLTAFHPDWRMRDVPATPPQTLGRAREWARAAGLKHVYVGNVHDRSGQTTYCPGCGAELITRDWFRVVTYSLTEGGLCPRCGAALAGVFSGTVGPADGHPVALGRG